MATETVVRAMRIGEVAEQTGLTPRTIRYYEEIGLLGAGSESEPRQQGKHRCYTSADVERIAEIVRLRDLLGLSLDQLSQLVEAETARAEIRREIKAIDDPERKRELITQAHGHITTQLTLVRSRVRELSKLEQELAERQALCEQRLAALGG
jgi:DNA-binding transcriptional MerR regulator